MSSCLRMPVAPGTSSAFATFVSAPTLMSFSVESSSFSGAGVTALSAVACGGEGGGCAAASGFTRVSLVC